MVTVPRKAISWSWVLILLEGSFYPSPCNCFRVPPKVFLNVEVGSSYFAATRVSVALEVQVTGQGHLFSSSMSEMPFACYSIWVCLSALRATMGEVTGLALVLGGSMTSRSGMVSSANAIGKCICPANCMGSLEVSSANSMGSLEVSSATPMSPLRVSSATPVSPLGGQPCKSHEPSGSQP